MQLSVANDPWMFSWERGSFRVWRGAMTFTAEASRTVRAAQGLGWAPVPPLSPVRLGEPGPSAAPALVPWTGDVLPALTSLGSLDTEPVPRTCSPFGPEEPWGPGRPRSPFSPCSPGGPMSPIKPG